MSPLCLVCAALTALFAGFYDHRTGHMPNWLTLGSLALALSVRTGLEGSRGAADAWVGTLVVASVPAGLFYLSRGKAIGGGDVKGLAALGAWMGPSAGLEVEMLSLMLICGAALVQAAWSNRLHSLLRRSVSFGRGEPEQHTYMRFGPFLAAGTFLCVTGALCHPLLLWWPR